MREKVISMTTVICWNPPKKLPENARYILIRYFDEELEEYTFGIGSFENGVYSLSGLDGSWHDLPKQTVAGWAYPIYEKASR